MRKCKSCGITQEIELFPSAGVVKGKQYYRHLCKPCYHKQKRNRESNIREQVVTYKKTLKCNRCGFNDYRALQFHHVNGDKSFSVANMKGHSFERIKEEMNKCEVLCANCHQIEHFGA